jgi:hypothetical protein
MARGKDHISMMKLNVFMDCEDVKCGGKCVKKNLGEFRRIVSR